MHTDSNPIQPPSAESRKLGYETTAPSIKGLVWFVVGLILTALVVHAGMWYLLFVYNKQALLLVKPQSALTSPQFLDDYAKRTGIKLSPLPQPPPPAPRIQPTFPDRNLPGDDLQLMYQKEDEVFRRMGWTIDEQSHVPLTIPDSVQATVIREENERRNQARPSGNQASASASPANGGGIK